MNRLRALTGRAVARPSILVAFAALGGLAVACSASPEGENAVRSSEALTLPHPLSYPAYPPTTVTAFGAADLENAYNIPTYLQPNTTIAVIVSGGDDPNAEEDLAVYRAAYGLPPCTASNSCLTKVTEGNSTTGLPPVTVSSLSGISSTGIVTSTALDMASAGCPSCNLLVVELVGGAPSDLLTAVGTAKARNASAIISTVGWPSEFTPLPADDSALDQPGITVFSAIGQSPPLSTGGTTLISDYPSTSPRVISVGVTDLSLPNGLSTTPLSESASPSGWSLCSSQPKPSWQAGVPCAGRAANDVAATGGPVWTFNTFEATGAFDVTNRSGWSVQGGPNSISECGTPMSGVVASSLVAAIFAQTNNGGAGPQYPYTNAAYFNDVTAGAVVENGATCSGYLCNAIHGYDGPTGLGTPDGMDMALVNRDQLTLDYGTINQSNPHLGDQGTSTLVVSPGVTDGGHIVSTNTTWASGCTFSVTYSGLPQGVSATNQIAMGSLTEPAMYFQLTGAASATLGQQSTMTIAATACGVTQYTQAEIVVQPCVPTVTSCSRSQTCGSIVNNCGQTIECGTCSGAETCSNGGCCIAPLVWNGVECARKQAACKTPAQCCLQAGGDWTGSACE